MTAQERKRTTYHYERYRAGASGILETAGTTFLLLIAVRHFESGSVAKAIIGGGASLGLMIGPWLVSRVQSARWPAAKAASRIALFGSVVFGIVMVIPLETVFVIGSAIALACAPAVIPLMTQIYHENYPERERGTLFSRTVMIRIAAAAAFSYLAGTALSQRLEQFQLLLLVFAGAFGISAWSIARCPSRPLTIASGTHPFRSLRYAKTDRLFRLTLISWMVMGFGNLMMLPLRVEYLANPAHGWTSDGVPMTAALIAVLTGVAPNVARLVLNPFWGWAFDRMNFFVLRITLNVGFLLAVLTFFNSTSIAGLIVGALLYGVSQGGGDIAWSLWVTKFAPPGRVADYMSVHTFFTGVRGFVAPVLAFQLITVLPVSRLSWMSAGLILVATVLLVPEIRYGLRSREATALTEEVSD